ncbi:TetR family transcriptional regulator [Actinomadura rubrobrunea]|uniref:TetR family transcriptional regulator n=1 Tax=Actinomadura rubrobrunea TaxID=115335 RepID=A0A9W6UVD5_9ACTN|nr:TetR/AcrR family transcriptional regulator [Actinomadura rubrobrunea]GLW64924.1 TetR family transcriptional regulator [Actinomadura rubrobrunea]
MSDAKAALLDRVIEHLAAEGVGDRSLRRIAAGAGTSHRMLIYHFGSRDGLLVEVVKEMERRQREVLARLRATCRRPRELARAFWRHLSDPALAPYERLFFELYGLALTGHPVAAPLLDGIVDSWLEGLEHVPGATPEERRVRARMILACTRGALLDLLATGDREEIDRMVEEFIALSLPE